MENLTSKYTQIQKQIDKTNTQFSTAEKEFTGYKKLFASMTLDELKYNFNEYINKLKTLFDNMNTYEKEIERYNSESETVLKQIQEEEEKEKAETKSNSRGNKEHKQRRKFVFNNRT